MHHFENQFGPLNGKTKVPNAFVLPKLHCSCSESLPSFPKPALVAHLWQGRYPALNQINWGKCGFGVDSQFCVMNAALSNTQMVTWCSWCSLSDLQWKRLVPRKSSEQGSSFNHSKKTLETGPKGHVYHHKNGILEALKCTPAPSPAPPCV